MSKVPCHYCGVEILEDTARRTNGYCMPHSGYGSFSEKIGGEFEIVSRHTQQEVEKTLSNTHKKVFEIIKSLMIAGDELVKFRTTPTINQETFAESGYAIYREQKYFTGFVIQWKENPKYFEGVETEVGEDEIKKVFGEDWDKIKNKIKEGDKFVYFTSSPYSWDHLFGRDYYCIKRRSKYLYQKLVSMN